MSGLKKGTQPISLTGDPGSRIRGLRLGYAVSNGITPLQFRTGLGHD